MSETQLVRGIIGALQAKGVWCWRVNSGATVIKSAKYGDRFLSGAPKGSPDIMGIVPESFGRLFGIEAKSPKGKQNPNQKAWEKRALEYGVAYGVARSISDALGHVSAWERHAEDEAFDAGR